MKLNLLAASALGLLMTFGIAAAQQPNKAPLPSTSSTLAMTEFLAAAPVGSLTVTNWYKENVYDVANVKIGDISDVLVSPTDGKITAVIIGVGGFLGMGQKDVAVPFNGVKRSMVDGKVHLTINTTKEALTAAHGLKYDSNTSSWILANVAAK